MPALVNQKVGLERVQWQFYGRPPMPMKDGKPEPDWQQEVWDSYERMLFGFMKGRKNCRVFPAQGPDKYGSFYTNFDVAIAPLEFNNFNDSKSEIKVAECGRYAIPLVASNVGCYDETIKNGETGYLIDPSNPKHEWVKIMSRLAKDKKHREEMGRNLKEITDEAFDMNKVSKFRLELYEAVMNK